MKTKFDFPPGTKVRINDYFYQQNPGMRVSKIREGIVVKGRLYSPNHVSIRRNKNTTERFCIDFLDIIP